MERLVKAIHKTPHKAIISITGGGTEAIGELLRHGNGSETLLKAVVPYWFKSFDKEVKGVPDKYCSPGAARDLAMAAFQEAISLGAGDEFGNQYIIGIGATSSLVKEGEREGRQHHAYIAVQTLYSTKTYSMRLDGNDFTREDEEQIVGGTIIELLAQACGLNLENFPSVERVRSECTGYESSVETTSGLWPQGIVLKTPAVRIVHHSDDDEFKEIIFPGSFNPIHDQHIAMAEKIHELTGKKVSLELCISNVDKPALNYTEIETRIKNLKEKIGLCKWLGNIYLTNTPKFADKSIIFKNFSFLIGWDTFTRICNPKYGNVDEALDQLKSNGTNFHVFHRMIDGTSSEEFGLKDIHPKLLEISKIFGSDVLPVIDISSTQIRKHQNV